MGNVRLRNGRLFFDFRFRGIRCREQTTLDDTAANRKRMHKVLDKIEQAIVTGTFQYADFFPGNALVEKFADKGASPVVSRALPMEAERAPGTPLFRTYIEDWFTLSLPSWRKSHAATVRSTIDRHLTPHLGDIPVGTITKTDLLHMRVEIAKRKGRGGNETLSAKARGKLADLRRVDRHINRTLNSPSCSRIVAYFTGVAWRSTLPPFLGRRSPPPAAPAPASAGPARTASPAAPRHPDLADAPSHAMRKAAPAADPDRAPPSAPRPSPHAAAPAA